jgi:hypothetical protein
MSRRALPVSLLTAALLAGLTAATISPAAAQGDPVYGEGNVYFLSGAYNPTGEAQAVFAFGDPSDEIYFGDWYGEGVDLPMVRRGNVFFVPSGDDPSVTASVFAYGDEEDEVYIGDWDGDGVDSIGIRRGNEYFVKNDNQKTGIADRVFAYGDPEDYVLIGNWDGKVTAPVAGKDANGDGDFTDPADPATKTEADVAPVVGKGDTLTVVRGNEFFVKNTISTGIADYTFYFGDPDDALLVGDWAEVAWNGTSEEVESSDGADQLAVVRGNTYYLSTEFEQARTTKADPITQRMFDYGDPGDYVFVSALPTALDADGKVTDDEKAVKTVITGDGLGVRRLG